MLLMRNPCCCGCQCETWVDTFSGVGIHPAYARNTNVGWSLVSGRLRSSYASGTKSMAVPFPPLTADCPRVEIQSDVFYDLTVPDINFQFGVEYGGSALPPVTPTGSSWVRLYVDRNLGPNNFILGGARSTGTGFSAFATLSGNWYDPRTIKLAVELDPDTGLVDMEGYDNGVLAMSVSAIPFAFGSDSYAGFYCGSGGEWDNFYVDNCPEA